MTVDVFISFGQSNETGLSAGTIPIGMPLAAVRFWPTVIGVNDSSAFGDLDALISGKHGAELQQGLVLHQRGYKVAHIKVSKNDTFLASWVPGQTNGDILLAEITAAIALLPTEFPAETFRYHLICKQGESEAKDATQTAALAWASNFATIQTAVEALVGPVDVLIVKTNSTIALGTWIATVQAQQASVADYLVSGDDLTLSDNLHYDPASQNVLGQRIADVFDGVLATMGTLSAFARTTLCDHFRNKATYSPAGTHYCHAYASGVVVSESPASLSNNTTTWSDPASGAVTNDVAFTFADATISWGTVDEIRITTSATPGAGDELARHTLSVGVPINTGTGPLTIAIGSIDITFPTGALAVAVKNELLGLMFGGTAAAPRATTYGSYWAGDPQGAGAQAGSRVAITQASTWNSASVGLATTSAAISLTDQATGTYWAEHDASSGGNLLFSVALPATPSGGIIPAGGLRTSFT